MNDDVIEVPLGEPDEDYETPFPHWQDAIDRCEALIADIPTAQVDEKILLAELAAVWALERRLGKVRRSLLDRATTLTRMGHQLHDA